MINWHGLASRAIGLVNPHKNGTVKVSQGYDTSDAGFRVPKYATYRNVPMQVQALSSSDLRHVENLNLQGIMRSVYLYGDVAGVVRSRKKGGDTLEFDGRVWLVSSVVENWPGWCKVIVTEQIDHD